MPFINSRRSTSVAIILTSLTTIGLIISVTATALSIIKHIRIKDTLSELLEYESLLHTFKISYNYLPGDFPYGNIWGGKVCGLHGVNGLSGDGDGIVRTQILNLIPQIRDITIESYAAWCHLELAGMTSIDRAVITNLATTPQRTLNLPASKINVKAVIHIAPHTLHGTEHNTLVLTETSPGMKQMNSTLTPQEAYILTIKTKRESGIPNKVIVRTGDDRQNVNECVNKYQSFDMSHNNKSCIVHYVIDH